LGAINYKGVVLNWIHHLERLKVKNYIVLCVDRNIYEIVGAAHGVLIDYNVNATLKKYRRKKGIRISRSSESNEQITDNTEVQSIDKPVLSESFSGRQIYEERKLTSQQVVHDVRGTETDTTQNKVSSSNRRRVPKAVKSSPPKWLFDKQKAFTIMMYIKHSSILALLSAGHSVVWSDVDCIWVKICAVSFPSMFAIPTAKDGSRLHGNEIGRFQQSINSYVRTILGISTDTKPKIEQVDIAVQQGSSPFETSDVVGTAICTGFFVVNPTPASLLLIAAVQQTMISSVQGTCGENCSVGDQSVMNEHLMNYGNLKRWAERNSKIMYGPSYVTNNLIEETHFLHTNLSLPQQMIADAQHNQLSFGKGLVSNPNTPIVIGFLPYDMFPRGDARVNTTALAIRYQKVHERNNHTNIKFRSPTIRKNKLMTSHQARAKNANEWADLRENACIWHMYSKKDGKTKILTMIRDGVFIKDLIDEDYE
jgi:hypothetical protein